jgi:DNA polymerase IV
VLTEKEQFFYRLSALDESSDEEQDTNDVRDVLRNSKRLSPSPPFPSLPVLERIRIPVASAKPLGLQRTTSAPTSGLDVEDTPKNPRKPLFRRSESAAPSSSDLPVLRDPPESILEAKPHNISKPTLETNSLVLSYSNGIETMLGKRSCNRSGLLHPKKKLRKENSIKLVLEKDQIFKGQTFYYIPPDSMSLLRRTRITKAREFGATYTESLTPNTTHIVVDKDIIFRDVMTFLKLETLPPNIILVTEEYPVDSIHCRYLLDPTQNRYTVDGHRGIPIEPEILLTTVSQASDVSPEIEEPRSLAAKDDYIPPNHTPPRSHES